MFSILNKLTGRATRRRRRRRSGRPPRRPCRRRPRPGRPPIRSRRSCRRPTSTSTRWSRRRPRRRPPPAFGPVDAARTEALKEPIVAAISTVFDPEIPVNIYELGLIYKIEADAESRVHVDMTLTSPACPSAQQLPSEVRYKVKAVEGVSDCTVEVVWEPPWTKDMMSETAKLTLGMF